MQRVVPWYQVIGSAKYAAAWQIAHKSQWSTTCRDSVHQDPQLEILCMAVTGNLIWSATLYRTCTMTHHNFQLLLIITRMSKIKE